MVVVMVLAIGVATLTPANQINTTPWYCLWCDDQALADAIVNVVMFVPLGFALRAASVSARRGILFSAALATTVEVMQGTVIVGRDPSLRDALTNTLGAALGVLIAARWRVLVAPNRRAAAWLAASAAALWLGTVTLSGVAMQPCSPSTPYDAEWSPLFPNERPFLGRVVGATLYGDSLRDGPIPDAIRDRFQSGRVALTTRVIPDPDRHGSAFMLAVVGFQRVVLSIAHSGRSVVVSLPQCSWRLRLRPTLFTFARALDVAFATAKPDRATLAIDAAPDRVDLVASGDESHARRVMSVRITPFYGWSLVRPFDARVRDGTKWITALWLAGLLLPFGYWLGNCVMTADGGYRTSRSIAAAMIAIGVLLIGLVGVSRVFSLAPADAQEWIEALVGVAAGARLASVLSRRAIAPTRR